MKWNITYFTNSFLQKGHLTQHLMIHEGGRPHKCKLCDKTFIFKFDLNRHMKIHAERGHSCRRCSKSFGSEHELNGHICKKLSLKKEKPLTPAPSFSSSVDSTPYHSPSIAQSSPMNMAQMAGSPLNNNQLQLAKLTQLLMVQQQQRAFHDAFQNINNKSDKNKLQLQLILQQQLQQFQVLQEQQKVPQANGIDFLLKSNVNHIKEEQNLTENFISQNQNLQHQNQNLMETDQNQSVMERIKNENIVKNCQNIQNVQNQIHNFQMHQTPDSFYCNLCSMTFENQQSYALHCSLHQFTQQTADKLCLQPIRQPSAMSNAEFMHPKSTTSSSCASR